MTSTLLATPIPAAADPLRLVRIRHRFDRPLVADVGAATRDAVSGSGLSLSPGASVAIAVGSRGVANLSTIVRAVVDSVRALGGEPFIVPAMGSHGGGTADGQEELLAGYGVTEREAGCPVRSSMEVVEIPGPEPDCRVFMDRLAWESDGVILVNRIKPHTDFRGRYESGLLKMSVVGLGKAVQAAETHRHGVRGLVELLPRAGAAVLATGRILLGVAVVENAYDDTMHVEAVPPERLLEREPELLEMARSHMPRLPVDRLDLLLVDRMGKNISGVGIDTNIIGRLRIRGQPEPSSPDISMIVVTDLTDESHGNATGMGLADICTRRFFDKIDFGVTNTNVATSGFLERARMPMVAATDRQAVEWALRSCGPASEGRERVVRILDTLHLAELHVSPAVLHDLRDDPRVEVAGEPTDPFDADGALRPF